MPRRIEPTIPAGAQLIQRSGSDVWYVQWYDPDIKRMRRWSTGAADRAAAEAAWERVAAGPRKADPPQGASPAFVSIAAVLDYYVERHAGAIASADQARIAVRRLKDHFKDTRVADLADEALQQAYATARHEAGVREATIDRELSVLRAAILFHAARNAGAPAPKIYGVHLPERTSRWLTPAEADRLAAAATSPHVYLFILLALATAARPEALFDLTWDRVDLAAGLIRLNPDGRVQTAKRRPTVPIDRRLRPALEAAFAGRTCDHVIEYAGYPIDSIRKAFKETALRAGFAPRELRPYTLRHSAATWMAQRGVPMWEIAGFLGHADTRMVERTYAHHHPDHLNRARGALGDAMAEAGMTDNPMIAALARRDPAALAERRQKRDAEASEAAEGSHNPLTGMVGAAGIEPATPTMST